MPLRPPMREPLRIRQSVAKRPLAQLDAGDDVDLAQHDTGREAGDLEPMLGPTLFGPRL